MKKLIFTAITASFLVACTNYSADRIKSNTAMAEAGADGACIQAIHDTAVNLEIANEMITVSEEGRLGKSDHQRGMAASEAAVKSRAIMEDTCTVRAEVLAEGLAALYLRTLQMPGVNFNQDSAELTTEAKPILEAMASNLVRENSRVEVAGHTSNTGSESYNLNLSQERAESVMAYLKSMGVPAGNMTAKGYGMSEPVADNATQDGRNANKRVELRYLK
jgi:outer membrane protein OmpA-like peptidoglycan-associated protein